MTRAGPFRRLAGHISRWFRAGDHRLACGCPDEGTIYGCLKCANTRCQQHRHQPHDCPGAAT